MKNLKKLSALVLAGALVFSLAACGGGTSSTPETTTPAETTPAETTPAETAPAETTPAEVADPDAIDDNMTSEDNTYQVAFVTDVGQLKD